VRIDLHAHSTASDGTDPPADLMRAASAAGLDVVALTDHDTVSGWADALAAAETLGITMVPGAEISCRWHGVSLHLLAFLFDPANPDLLAEMERTRAGRAGRAEKMVAQLAADYPISWSQVQEHATGDTVGRPHIADALVESGVVASRDEAFDRLLHSRSPYYIPHAAPGPVDAVRLVGAAGGVSVFAHPGARGRGEVVPDHLIVEMADAGMAGLEVDHRDHDAATRARLRDLAARLALLVTGSSDYHGTGKLNRLGENTTSPEAYAAIVAAATSGVAPVGGP
jgi:predicted metal-dependent phosphoesterase TrpH